MHVPNARSSELPALIERLRAAGIVLRPQGDQLRYEAPKGALSSSLLEAIRAHKTELLAFLRSAQQSSGTAETIAPAARERAMPVSVAQRRIWFLYHFEQRGATYNVPKAVRLRGSLDVDALERAFGEVIRRHESLRTSFEEIQGEPFQVVHEGVSFRLPRHDLDAGESHDPLGAARARVTEAAREPFDLAAAPLIRAVVFRLDPDDHVLLVVLHHIVADGRSLEVLFEELAAAYAAARTRSGPHLAPLPIQYVDFAVFERTRLERPGMTDEIEWWRARLAGASPLLPIPTDRPRPAVQTFEGGMEPIPVPAALTRRLRELAREREASLYMTMVAAMSALLSAFSGEDDICIGCPVENRPFPETSRLIGVFINTVVLRVHVDWRTPFSALLDSVRTVALDAYEHQDVPFERLVEALQPERNTSASPLFQVALSSLDGRRAFPSLEGVETEPFDFDFGRVKFDFNLELYETNESLHIAWFYKTALFDANTARRWGAHLVRLLERVVAEPTTPLTHLGFIPDDDVAALRAWNATAVSYPSDRTVVDLFEEQARRTPFTDAVVCGDRALSYADLQHRADAVASCLETAGVGKGALVALFMERSVDVVAAILGVLKSGAAYLPLDTAAPADRIAFMLRDSCASVVIVADGNAALPADQAGTRVVRMDEVPVAPATASHRRLSPLDTAYVLYTSGSTGTPKAVVMGHRGLLNYVWWAQKTYASGRGQSFPLFTSLSFDLTVTSLFVPLLTGGRIVVYPEDRTMPSVLQVVRDKAVDIVKLTPAHLAMIAELDLRATGIRTLIVGGEDLKTDLARRAADSFDNDVEIYNEYGPTETAVGCMIHRFDRARDTGISVPIGVPADNARVYILDRSQQIAPIGAVGELYVGGDGVALGYLHRVDLTAERFLPDPVVAGRRMYRTGDLGKRRADGSIEYLGRSDRQIKVRGHRIELDEVAAALSAHDAVSDCVVELVTREIAAPREPGATYCARCGLSSTYPGTTFDEAGVCDVCRAFERHRHRVETYFRTPGDFAALLTAASSRRKGPYDVLALVSGGKDSTYAVARLVALGARVLAYTFDPGYLSDQAKDNIRQVTARLGIDHVFGETPHMGEIFADSLRRHANVCNGCFKALYTLSIAVARERGIPMIVTGLSRGQLFETRLSKYYNNPNFDSATLDAAIVEARKVYHALDDVIARRLDVRPVRDERIFDEIQVVDFYRYFDVSLREMRSYLDGLGWKRPSDTGRSTNCLINDVGIYVHKRRRGYHNYALPYSWDVRMGHKTRSEALAELDDEIDEARVRRILATIGAPEPPEQAVRSEPCLVAYYVPRVTISDEALRAHMADRLPSVMVPAAFVALESLPLTPNGKVNRRALPVPPTLRQQPAAERIPPRTTVERDVAAAWSRALGFDGFGIHDNFFALGGHSLMATQVAARLMEQFAIELPLAVLFEKPTIAELAAIVDSQKRAQDATLDELLDDINKLTDEQAKEELGL